MKLIECLQSNFRIHESNKASFNSASVTAILFVNSAFAGWFELAAQFHSNASGLNEMAVNQIWDSKIIKLTERMI